MSPDSTGLYLQANRVATLVSMSLAEVDLSVSALWHFYSSYRQMQRGFHLSGIHVSMPLPCIILAHTMASHWQRLSCLYHVEIQLSSLSAVLHLPYARLAHIGLFLAEVV